MAPVALEIASEDFHVVPCNQTGLTVGALFCLKLLEMRKQAASATGGCVDLSKPLEVLRPSRPASLCISAQTPTYPVNAGIGTGISKLAKVAVAARTHIRGKS